MLKIVITDTESGEVHFDDEVKSLCVLAVSTDGKSLGEMIMRASLLDVATMISGSRKVRQAADLAATMRRILDSEHGYAESDLLNAIMGGKDNEEDLQ